MTHMNFYLSRTIFVQCYDFCTMWKNKFWLLIFYDIVNIIKYFYEFKPLFELFVIFYEIANQKTFICSLISNHHSICSAEIRLFISSLAEKHQKSQNVACLVYDSFSFTNDFGFQHSVLLSFHAQHYSDVRQQSENFPLYFSSFNTFHLASPFTLFHFRFLFK